MDYAPSQLPYVDAVELVDLKGLQPNLVSEYMRIAFDAPFVRVKGETAQHPHSQQLLALLQLLAERSF